MGFPYNTPLTTIQGSTAAYAANNVIGTGINALTPVAKSGLIQAFMVIAKSTMSAQIDVMTFASSMPNSTFTDHSSIAISSLDVASCGPVIPVTNYAYGGVNCTVGTAAGLAYPYVSGTGGGNTLWFALVARAALTVNSTSDFAVSATLIS